MELYDTSISIQYNFHRTKRGVEMAHSKAQQEATARYNKKAYDRIDLIVPKGKRRIIAEFAEARGMSTNKFINEAIDNAMNAEKEDT